jgi:hypothetical protein
MRINIMRIRYNVERGTYNIKKVIPNNKPDEV